MMMMKMISANVDDFVSPSLPTHSPLIIIFHILKMNQIQYDGEKRDYQYYIDIIFSLHRLTTTI
jgi:hypothetical protein